MSLHNRKSNRDCNKTILNQIKKIISHHPYSSKKKIVYPNVFKSNNFSRLKLTNGMELFQKKASPKGEATFLVNLMKLIKRFSFECSLLARNVKTTKNHGDRFDWNSDPVDYFPMLDCWYNEIFFYFLMVA